VEGRGREEKGRKGEEKERGGKDPLDLLPLEKFPSYATAAPTIVTVSRYHVSRFQSSRLVEALRLTRSDIKITHACSTGHGGAIPPNNLMAWAILY